MFGGYLGQKEDMKRIEKLRAEVKENPDSLELRKALEKAEKHYQDRMDSALRAYSRI